MVISNSSAKWLRVFSFLFLIFLLGSCSNKSYQNSDGTQYKRSIFETVRWLVERDLPASQEIDALEIRDVKVELSHAAIWIGHSTFLINNGELNILIDPVFSERASPFLFVGPKRMIPPAIKMNQLPRIDIVLISHNHYDHLDIASLSKLSNINNETIFLVPEGDKKSLVNAGIKNTFEFKWWDNFQLNGTTFTFTPAKHWSARGLFDDSRSLWGSWHVGNDSLNLFHAGDTGYSDDFKLIKKKLGKVDLALIPIGAYSPYWFMGYSHVTPDEAIQIAIDLEATKSIGMHWGTFILSDEPILEPKEWLKISSKKENIDFVTVKPGELIDLSFEF
tara:strand:- start:203 stop:1204 length:1002 start_codon:yes stop_codon:yes gene_type:complete